MRPTRVSNRTSPSSDLAKEVLGPKNWAAWIIGTVLAIPPLCVAYYLYTLSAGADQVDKGFKDVDKVFKDHATMMGGLSSQISTGFDLQRGHVVDIGRTMSSRFDELEQKIGALQPPLGAGSAPAAEGRPGSGQPASVTGPSGVPAPMHQQLWRVEVSPTPGGKPLSVAFGVTAADPRIKALLLSQIGVELGNLGLVMTPANGQPADQYVSFNATFDRGTPQAGCNIMKNITLRGSFTGGARPSGDLLHTVAEQCLDGQSTADEVKDYLVSIAARRAASGLVSRSSARL